MAEDLIQRHPVPEQPGTRRTRSPAASAFLRILSWGLQALLPLLCYVGLAVWCHPVLALQADRVLVGTGSLHPSDSNGTLWFYWWMHRALETGQPLLFSDAICAPTGQPLGRNFPNRIDAWLAMPFYSSLPFPQSYNLFVLSLLVLGAWSAWALARRVTRSSLVAIPAGAFFGFNAYSYWEIQGGRPVTALVALLPLFLLALLWALETPSRLRALLATGAAGGLAALVVNAYILFALFLLGAALVLGLASLLAPAPAVSRLRGLPVGLGITVVASLASGPYLYEQTVIRTLEPERIQSASDLPTMPSAVSPALWSALLEQGRLPLPASGRAERRLGLEPQIWADLQVQSQPWTWLWYRPVGEAARRVAIPPALWVTALVLLPFAARRYWCWLGVTIYAWLLTLGPQLHWVAESHRMVPVRWLGLLYNLPVKGMVQVLPELAEYLRPYRAAPLVVLGFMMLWASGLEGLLAWVTARIGTRPGRRRSRVARTILLVSPLLLLWAGFWHLSNRREFDLPTSPWRPDAFLTGLASNPEGGAVIELPMGAGHATALAQVIHQRPRSEPHHDAGDGHFQTDPPSDCYRHPLLRSLWRLERAAGSGTPLPPIPAEQLEQAREAGFHHVLVYPRAYEDFAVPGRPRTADPIVAALEQILGPPLHRTEQVIAFELPTRSGAGTGHGLTK